jgi:hypothetical protein
VFSNCVRRLGRIIFFPEREGRPGKVGRDVLAKLHQNWQ